MLCAFGPDRGGWSWRRSGGALGAACVAALALVAGAAADARNELRVAGVSACSVLNVAQASSVLGIQAKGLGGTSDRPPRAPGAVSTVCSYAPANPAPPPAFRGSVLQINILEGNPTKPGWTASAAEKSYNATAAFLKPVKPVLHLGDASFWTGSALWTLDGTYIVAIGGQTSHGGYHSFTEAQDAKLMKQVLAKLHP